MRIFLGQPQVQYLSMYEATYARLPIVLSELLLTPVVVIQSAWTEVRQSVGIDLQELVESKRQSFHSHWLLDADPSANTLRSTSKSRTLDES